MGIFAKVLMMPPPAVPDVQPLPITLQHQQIGTRLELTRGEKMVEYTAAAVGATCTLLALFGMVRSSLRGESRKAQMYMRYRVMAQFFTVSAVASCLIFFAARRRPNVSAEQSGDAQSSMQ